MNEEKNFWGHELDKTSQDLKISFAQARRPLLEGLAIILFFYLLSWLSFLDWSQLWLNLISGATILVVVVVVGYKIADQHWEITSLVTTTTVLVGGLLAIWQAIWQSIWFWSWWRLPEGLVEIIGGLLWGVIAGILITKIVSFKNKKNNQAVLDLVDNQSGQEENNYAEFKKSQDPDQE